MIDVVKQLRERGTVTAVESSPVQTARAGQRERATSTRALRLASTASVLEALWHGEPVTGSDLIATTGLTRATVDAAIEHLERTGALRRERMASSCPSSGCGGCAHATADGSTCSSSRNGAATRGPVALVLTRRP